MRLISVFLLSSTIFLVTLLSAGAQLEGSYWSFSIEGDAAIGIEGLEGTRFDVQDDFGYDDETAWGVSLAAGSTVQVGASYLQWSASGRETISRTIKFRDLTLPASAAVSSSFDVEILRGFLRLNLGADALRAGVVGGVQYIQLEGSAAASGVGRAAADASAPMPIIGAHVQFRPVRQLQLHAQALGMTWEFDEVDATFLEVEGAVRFYPMENLFLGGGYRYITVDVTDKSEIVEVDLTFQGPVAYAGLAW